MDRISRLSKFLDDQGIHVVCAILSILPESREWNRKYRTILKFILKLQFRN